ncbi:MAG: glycoside hydrolase family 3 C-terminal domain-containing protein [Bacteroidales bacterium]
MTKSQRIRLILTGLICSVLLTSSRPGSDPEPVAKIPVYLNTSYSFEERAADLVSRLTPKEKESLLGNMMAPIPRLGIRSYNVWSEALHGVLSFANPAAGLEGPTSFPNSVALGSTWSPELVERVASAIADEARAIHATGTKGLTFWSPVVEPIRDPRWGRTGETYGEDPFLVSQIAGGFIRGMTGPDPTYLKTVPCGKHYFANNSEFDRHVSSSDMDARDMREYYLSPYKWVIEKDRLPSIMSSYNAVNGVPTSASKLYLDTIARRTYGLDGYITGDCAAIEDIYTGHYYVETAEEATAQGLKAGVDCDCGSVYQSSTLSALNQGLIAMEDIDKALLNLFVIRMRTGEFDPPARVPYAQYQTHMVNSPANKSLAQEVATKTPVLLKNNVVSGTKVKGLPLDPAALQRIALIGPQADEVELGPYSGRPNEENLISPLAGIRKYVEEKGLSTEIVHHSGGNTASKSNLLYVAGFELYKANGEAKAYDATKYSFASEGITVGSGMGSVDQIRTIDDGSWTAYDNIDLTGVDSMGLVVNIPTEGGIIEVRVGSPDGNLIGDLNATAASGRPVGGVYGAGSLMKIKVNRLGVTEPQTVYLCYKAPMDAPIGEETLALAKSSDVAVVFVGTDEKTATEEADRLTLLLPGNQVELIKAVSAVNPHTIVVMQTLGCVEVEEFKENPNIPGIIWVGYNGQAQGDAMARILFGDANPGGKLNATWYKSVRDLPPITDYTLRGGQGKPGRTLWYFDQDVSYEFGYGLSYTSFEYSNFRISQNTIGPNDRITLQVDVKNIGTCDGDEVVQVYLRTPDSPAGLERPIKRLKGFQRVTLPVGQSKTVAIDMDCSDLWFWDMEQEKITFDPGTYLFEIGASSRDIKGVVSATMEGSFQAELKTVVAECGSLILKKGESRMTQLTAAMSDDRFLAIEPSMVEYSSNNPKVATVDEHGMVTGTGTGVATIVVKVRVNGKTVEDRYPVKVPLDLSASAIQVDGKDIQGFRPDTPQYSFLKIKPSPAPLVTARPADPGARVEIVQAQGVPGTAVVTLFDDITCDQKTYLVNFGTRSENDDFTSPSLGGPWHWQRENSTAWSLATNSGSLAIQGEDGDLIEGTNNARNLLLQSANTDWNMETKIVLSRRPSGFTENAGLIAYQDDDNFVKLSCRPSFGRRSFRPGGSPQPAAVELLVESMGQQLFAVQQNIDELLSKENAFVLRMTKKGSQYTAFFSADGEHFVEIGQSEVLLKDVQAGVLVNKGDFPAEFAGFLGFMQAAPPPATSFEAAFDYFRIENSGLK